MYRRPYLAPTPVDATPPADSPPAAPFITRHALPPNGTWPIIRFIAVVFLVSCAAVTVARVAGQLWHAVGGLLALAGVALFLSAGVKALWVGRTTRVPMLSAVVALVALGCALGTLKSGGGLGLLTNVALGVVLFAASLFIPAAWWLDGLTKTLDAKTTAALGGGLVLLAGIAVIPFDSTDFRLYGGLTLLANELLALLLMWTYAGYVLANPAHPRDTMNAGTERWLRILCGRDRAAVTPLAKTVLVLVLALLAAVVSPEWFAPPADGPPAEPLPPGPRRLDEAAAAFLGFHTVVLVVVLLFGVGFVWELRRPLGRALAVWMLYTGAPLPGVYQPDYWLASVRVRRIALAAVITLNVAYFRTTLALTDAAIAELVFTRGPFPADVPQDVHCQLALFYLSYAIGYFLPLLLPAALLLWPIFAVRPLHTMLEERAPADPNTTPEG